MQQLKLCPIDILIEGIKNLTRLIDSIDNVISMMKDISNQTKIIAMNAELEAVSAKDEGNRRCKRHDKKKAHKIRCIHGRRHGHTISGRYGYHREALRRDIVKSSIYIRRGT